MAGGPAKLSSFPLPSSSTPLFRAFQHYACAAAATDAAAAAAAATVAAAQSYRRIGWRRCWRTNKIIILPLALVRPHHYSVAAGITLILPLPLLLTLLQQQQQQQQHKHTTNCYGVETF